MYHTKSNDELIQVAINKWHQLFKDYPYNAVESALNEYAMTSKDGYPPAPGQINAIIARNVADLDPDRPVSAEQAWQQITQLFKKGVIYRSQEAFEELPQLTKKVVGSPSALRDWAQREANQLDFIRKDFIATYNKERNKFDRGYLNPNIAAPILKKIESRSKSCLLN